MLSPLMHIERSPIPPMEHTDSRLILLSPEDNCVIVAQDLAEGTTLMLEGTSFTLPRAIATGHKLARRALSPEEKVVRYGAVIGHATVAVAKGEHLHTHNLVSDYIPTYTHDDGRAFVQH
jgi:altronate dehydratase small subunit